MMGPRHKGFTLIEIVIVLMIIAVLMTSAAWSFKGFMAAVNLQIAGDRLVQEIRNTQQSALAENSTEYSYFMQFYPDPVNAYVIKRSATPGPIILATVRLPGSVTLVTTNFDSQMLSISNRGIPARGGTITLKNRVNGKLRYVIVASITGRVRVSDRPPESWEIIMKLLGNQLHLRPVAPGRIEQDDRE